MKNDPPSRILGPSILASPSPPSPPHPSPRYVEWGLRPLRVYEKVSIDPITMKRVHASYVTSWKN